ncbi:cytochrome P450 [Mycena latifolia]|nr:cytochrome P450 [Mycena latifolia]
MAGTSTVILSSVEAAVDLLDKRSAIYSDRPQFTMFHELVGGEALFAFGKYDNIWRASRRLFHQALDGAAGRRFRPQGLKHAHDLLRRLLDAPDAFVEHFNYVLSAHMISVTYGLDVVDVDDPYVKASDAGIKTINAAASPGQFLVDNIPILKHVPAWVPGAGFRRQAAKWKKSLHRMLDLPFDAAKHALNDGTPRLSFVVENLLSLDQYADKEKQETIIKGVAANMYVGGIDTSSLSLRVFVLAMLQNPEAQKKAQHEIDSVVQHGHLPDFADEADLPYVSACVKETLRWWPVAPLVFPRLLHVEDTYRGYRIPSGSVIVTNAWAILHDETVYPDPHAFNPDRYLIDGKLDPAFADPHPAFGFGRRICAGKEMAWSTLWIMIASMLAAFEFTKVIGEDGEVIEPTPRHTSKFLDSPLPFKCSIKPRSKEVEEIIQSMAV